MFINKYNKYVSNELTNLNENQQSLAGKNVFTSFLKVLTSLQLKESNPDWENTPDNFLIYYRYNDVESAKYKSIIQSRFRSLSLYNNLIDYNETKCNLYYGIKTDMTFEYGYFTDEHKPIGAFKLSRSNVNWLSMLSSPSAASLKKEIISLEADKLKIYCKIKEDMLKYNPGRYQKKSFPTIEKDIFIFGYYGMGRWDHAKLNDEDYTNVKRHFVDWCSGHKWHDKVKVSVKADSHWIYFKFLVK